MVCRACRLLTTAFHKQVEMHGAGYVCIYLSQDCLPASKNSQHTGHFGITFITFLFFSVCLCEWKLYQVLVTCHWRHGAALPLETVVLLLLRSFLQWGHGTWQSFMCASSVFFFFPSTSVVPNSHSAPLYLLLPIPTACLAGGQAWIHLPWYK